MHRLMTSCLLWPLLAAGPAFAQEAELARLAWLGGCWQSETAEAGSGEHWLPLAGGTLLGVSRTVRNGRTAEFEFMQIRALDDGRLAFIALPSGQSYTEFPLAQFTATGAVFENPAHDFPQRVIYELDAGGVLRARIEGLRRGELRTVEFPMRRVSCDAPGAAE